MYYLIFSQPIPIDNNYKNYQAVNFNKINKYIFNTNQVFHV